MRERASQIEIRWAPGCSLRSSTPISIKTIAIQFSDREQISAEKRLGFRDILIESAPICLKDNLQRGSPYRAPANGTKEALTSVLLNLPTKAVLGSLALGFDGTLFRLLNSGRCHISELK